MKLDRHCKECKVKQAFRHSDDNLNRPIISVIVPAYNVELFILKCIESILSSTIKDFEVIAVDDCSTDNTLKILKSIKDTRLRIISLQTRNGVSVARNMGIEQANGEYISFVDGDDWVSPFMLERLFKTAKTTNADIVFCNHYSVEDDKTINTCDIKSDLEFVGEVGISKYIRMFLIKGKKEYEPYFPMGQVWGTLYHPRIMCENNLMFIEGMQYKEDVIFSLYAAQFANKIVRLNEPLYYYNKCNQGSLTTAEFKTGTGMPERIEKDIQERYSFLRKNRQDDEVFKAGYYHWVFKNFYGGFVSACVTDSSYAKCRKFWKSDLCKDAIQNIRSNELKPKEKIIYLLLKLHGLPLYYLARKAYKKIRRG